MRSLMEDKYTIFMDFKFWVQGNFASGIEEWRNEEALIGQAWKANECIELKSSFWI